MLLKLLNANGGLVKWVLYNTHPAIRERQVHYGGTTYEQAARLDQFKWAYRAIGPSPSPQNTPELEDVLQPDVPPEKAITWEDVDRWFAEHRNRTEPIQVSHVRDLESLIQAIRSAEAEADL